MDDITVTFPKNRRIQAEFGDWRVTSDQSAQHGGEGMAPEPFDYFLASLASCAGAYVSGFCHKRGIDTTGITLVQHHEFDSETHRLSRVELQIVAAAGFPEKYLPALERVAAKCTVKKVLEQPPSFGISAFVTAPQPEVRMAG